MHIEYKIYCAILWKFSMVNDLKRLSYLAV